MDIDNRISWDEYFMKIARLVAERGTCKRKKFGSVLVKDRIIVATGYNGSPKGMPHCIDIGCLMKDGHCTRTIHSEQNALIQAGARAKESILYCTGLPCPICFKMLIQAGIKKIIYDEDYNKKELEYWIRNGGIEVIKYNIPNVVEVFE